MQEAPIWVRVLLCRKKHRENEERGFYRAIQVLRALSKLEECHICGIDARRLGRRDLLRLVKKAYEMGIEKGKFEGTVESMDMFLGR